jgi:transcription elongation factor GreA
MIPGAHPNQVDPREEIPALTRDGIRRIQEELERLTTVRRQEAANEIRQSREYGDVIESGEFAAARASQSLIEQRIAELRALLANSRELEPDEIPVDQVGLGSQVTVLDQEEEEEWIFTLVNSVEADPERDLISVQCPLGEALLGRRVGETATAATPAGVQHYEILDIRRPIDAV